MIPKQDPIKSEGSGRPFDMREYTSSGKTDKERNSMRVIHLTDLNASDGTEFVPKNFVRCAGRTLDSFQHYWTDHDENEEYDIQ